MFDNVRFEIKKTNINSPVARDNFAKLFTSKNAVANNDKKKIKNSNKEILLGKI
jgi:hypothetical protein